MPIEGLVAEILDQYTLVANIGSRDGVEVGMEFEVYEEGPVVTDPETGEELGQPETVKIHVVADDVRNNMTVMETKEYTVAANPLRNLTTFQKTEKPKIKTDTEVKEDRRKVEVGDRLRQIVDGEDEDTAE